jgi:DNA-binding XRE family transcriptional regulator
MFMRLFLQAHLGLVFQTFPEVVFKDSQMPDESPNRLKELLLGDPTAEEQRRKDGFLKTSGMSVEQFANKIGVTRTSVYFYLGDRSRPTIETLQKICDLVGVSLAEGVAYCTPRTTGRQPRA